MNDNQDISFLTPEEVAEKYGKKVGVFGAYNEKNDKERISPIKRNADGTLTILPKTVSIGGVTFDGSEGNDTVEQIASQMGCTTKSQSVKEYVKEVTDHMKKINMSFNDYQEKAWSTFKLQSAPNKLIYLTLGINGEAGEIAEKVKKLIRDCGDGSGNVPEITSEKREELKKELGDVLWYLSGIATALDLSLEDVAASNIDKLASRKERGVIGGNGDNR